MTRRLLSYLGNQFTDMKRELELFVPLPDTDFTTHDGSSKMGGSPFPLGLRFPTGAILERISSLPVLISPTLTSRFLSGHSISSQ
jgi:hypothetical protein